MKENYEKMSTLFALLRIHTCLQIWQFSKHAVTITLSSALPNVSKILCVVSPAIRAESASADKYFLLEWALSWIFPRTFFFSLGNTCCENVSVQNWKFIISSWRDHKILANGIENRRFFQKWFIFSLKYAWQRKRWFYTYYVNNYKWLIPG